MKSDFDSTGLLEPQVEHAKFLLTSLYLNGGSLDPSDTGCGKTYVAASLARALNRPVVVICPKPIVSKWHTVLESFGVKAFLVINYEKLARGNTKWLKRSKKWGNELWKQIAHRDKGCPEFLQAKLNLPDNSFVILDESHKCKGRDSLNAGIMIACKRQGFKLHLMSATQATSCLEMYAFGYVIGHHDLSYKSFDLYCKDHGAEPIGKWGALTFDGESKNARTAMKKAHDNIFEYQGFASKLTRASMGSHFPDNFIEAVSLDFGKANTVKMEQIYAEMQREIDKLDERSSDYSIHIFAILTKARRKTELLKVPVLVEYMEESFKEENSPVCFINYTDTIGAMVDRFGKPLQRHINLIRGGQTSLERDGILADFQSDRKRIMIANIKSGGTGIDMHDLNGNYPRTSYINPGFSAVDVLQSLGRICRQGAKTKCLQKIVFAAGTIEETACQKVQMRINNLHTLNTGELTDSDLIIL